MPDEIDLNSLQERRIASLLCSPPLNQLRML